jgi:hypothetical protein
VKPGFGGLICCPSCRAPWVLDFRASTDRRGSSRRCDGHDSEHRLALPSSRPDRPDGSMQNRSPHATLEAVNDTAIARNGRGESCESRGRGMIQVNVMRAVAARSAVARWDYPAGIDWLSVCGSCGASRNSGTFTSIRVSPPHCAATWHTASSFGVTTRCRLDRQSAACADGSISWFQASNRLPRTREVGLARYRLKRIATPSCVMRSQIARFS